ncbi:hypothetical protein [uncultured Bacteroides sp.]|uniref:hypothetical protein n=1 Tax=uncultured Bacteroides sp. TaxID=162156 RepID=UPI002670B83E|nr:hypothetical protein [uncultured Bacteroides sp.]
MQEELQKWKSIDVYCHLSGNIRLLEDVVNSKKEPIKVTLRNEAGKKDFWIPYEKYIHNIEQSSDDLRGVHSYLLHISPLNADSLNIVWKNRLAELGFFGKTAIRISVSDWQEHETYTYSTDSFYLSKSDSLTVSYIGCRCEVGVTGYLYDSWWMIFSGRDITWLVALIAFCIFLFFMQNYVYRICCCLFVKQKSIVVEKEVSVVVCHKSYSHIYQLEEGVYFDIN